MAHNYSIYGRFLNIIGIDSTFIGTMVKGSGRYRRQKTENILKMYQASVIFPFTIPLESLVTPAYLNNSPEFDQIFLELIPLYRNSHSHIRSWILRSRQVEETQIRKHHVRDKDKEERQIWSFEGIRTLKDNIVQEWSRTETCTPQCEWRIEGLFHRHLGDAWHLYPQHISAEMVQLTPQMISNNLINLLSLFMWYRIERRPVCARNTV